MTASIDGQTNTGIVQRNGQVRGLTLPLAGGTNIVTLTATDAAGNSVTTNLTVVQSAVTVTIDPISSDQVNQSFVSVTGTVSDTNAAVTVNGISATVDGSGNWSADGVPVSATGVAIIEATASDPTNDPVTDIVQPQPPVLEVRSMHDNYFFWDADHLSDGGCWVPEYAQLEQEQWVNGLGGTAYDEEQRNDGHCGDPVETSSGTTALATNYFTYAADYYYANDSESGTYPGGDLWTIGDDENYDVVLANGGEGQPGTLQTFLILGSAHYQTSESSPYYKMPPEGLKILGRRLLNSEALNDDGLTNGVAIVSIPAGASLPNFMPSAPYKLYDASIQQTNPLQIVDNNTGSNLSAQVNTVVVGQQMNLSCQLTMTNAALNNSMLTNFQWTVPGYAISNYVASSQSGMLYTNFPTTNSNATFYWVDGASNRVLQCSATIDGATVTAQAVFNVIRPLPQFSEQDVGTIAADTDYHQFKFSALDGSIVDQGLNPHGTNWLHFGINSNWTNVGMAFAYSNAPTTLFTENTYGRYFLVQLISASDLKKNFWDGTNLRGKELVQYGLDTTYPYQSENDDWHIDGYSTRTSDMWCDGPASVLDGTTWVSRTNFYTIYLMFQNGYPNYTSAYSNSIPVPMYTATWSWSGVAATNSSPGAYGLLFSSPPNPTVSPTLTFPVWNTNAANFFYKTNLLPFNEN